MRIFDILILIILTPSSILEQTINPEKTIIGKWSICSSFKFEKNHKCDSIFKYEFKEDGTYIENRKTVCNYQHFNSVPGKWTIENDQLTIAEDEYCSGLTRGQVVNKIHWINENVFYLEGREGKNGPKVYTYFTKLK